MSTRQILFKDSRGYTCSSCRQRFPLSLNLSDFSCPGCRGVTVPSPVHGTRKASDSPSQTGFQVSDVVEKIKSKFLLRSDSDAPKTLNSSLSPLALRPLPSSVLRRFPSARKRAVLIGVAYAKMKYKLRGTVNDVKNMRSLLIEHFHFQEPNVLVLTEKEKAPELIPTKKNIMAALKWLVEDCQKGDSLVFYFSAHGLRQPDFNNDERDGFDETICPVDFMKRGMIFDNDINSTIVWPLPKGATLHAIVDACHSGSLLDLAYVYNRDMKAWQDNSPPSKTRKHTNGGLAISISACEDDQNASDTNAFSGKGMNGPLTYILVKILKQSPANQGPT